MYENDKAKLAKTIAEYKRLRRFMHELDVQSAAVDGRLLEIERQLPDDYPDDPPQNRLPRP